ncbi:hypothetical protein EG240_14500 [Paenimyroides tangerinum]|uniref:YD repeat-containing protein n=1 Tax=Paenimyroides tangerinum TaxID=2488728 RepID=A0A3P3VY86_9FLAO|nr:hypothetical protein [Paenimyroides tangerinum]RRJ87771.1 hypothetical protein EG240_14500 [Paenimyroides tangerinum]
MKKIILGLLTSTILFSCSSSDDETSLNEQPNPNMLKLKTVQEKNSNYEETYYYGNNDYVSKMENTHSVYDFIYEGNKIVSRTESYDGEVVFRLDYYYSGDLIIESFGNIYDGRTQRIEYTYDNAGRLVLEEIYEKDPIASNFVLMRTYEYKYDNNFIVKTIFNYVVMNSVYEYNYKYDDKHNPYYGIYPDSYSKIHKHFRNNIITSNDGQYDTQYEFEYDLDGYPTENRYKVFTYYPKK